MPSTEDPHALPPDPARRFGGVRRLYGEAAAARFERAEVCVIGLGGVGSWAAEALARSGIGALRLIDLDHVAESNVNRQAHALGSTLGRAKTEVMAERLRDIHPGCRVLCLEEFLAADNLAALLTPPCDWVVDCIDNFRTKAALVAWCRRRKQPLVTVGGAGGLTDPTAVRVCDLSRSYHDVLLARTRKLLRAEHGFTTNTRRRFDVPCVHSTEQPVFPDAAGGVCRDKPREAPAAGLSCASALGSVVTVTATMGLAAVSYVLRRLAATAEGRSGAGPG